MIRSSAKAHMERAGRITRVKILLASSRVLLATVAVLAVTAITSEQFAFAEAKFYSCSECTSKPGPNIHPLDYGWGKNRSGEGVCIVLWKYNGGTNYNVIKRNCEPKAKQNEAVSVLEACVEPEGHGDVESTYKEYNYSLEGYEGWYCD